MNADVRVMEFFRAPLGRDESDAMVNRIQKHFDEHGFGLWAIEVPGKAPFVGFCGLTAARFNAAFTPCIEVGWRLAFEYWRQGYATEASQAVLVHAFDRLVLPEVVSFTAVANARSRAVMERLRMRHDPADDFDHPSLSPDHPFARQVLYRLSNVHRLSGGVQ
jgi:RimJ/RimL family protein N-acetyltransferase